MARRLFKRFHARVLVDGVQWARDDFVAVLASCVDQAGLGFKPFYRCTEKPGHFAVLGVHTSPFGLVAELPRVHRGRAMRRHKVISDIAREVCFEADEPIAYVVNGDIYTGQRTVRVASGPEIEFILPQIGPTKENLPELQAPAQTLQP